jgi:hypothetical protein
MEEKDSANLGKAACYLFLFSVMPYLQDYVRLLEKIHINYRNI